MTKLSNALLMYTVYHNPSDFPGKFVVRRHAVRPGFVAAEQTAMAVCDSLDEARQALPPGLVSLGREPQDDPVIVESWV